MSDLASGLDALVGAMGSYQEAFDYYHGEVSPTFGAAMARQLAKSGYSNVKVNLARIPVDALADRLEISAITTGDDKTQQVLDDLAVANEFDTVLPDVFRDALMYGDMYLMLETDDENNVNLFPNDPLTTRIIYSAENPRVKAFAIKRWVAGSSVRVNLYYEDRVERYVTAKPNAKGVEADEFIGYTTADDADTDPAIDNPYGFIPVYHVRTGRQYGSPQHKAGYGCQDNINKIVVTHMASIDYLGFPQRYLISGPGLDASEIDDFDSDYFHDETTPEATNNGPDYGRTNYEGHSPMGSNPGGVDILPNGSSTGQWEPANSENFIESLTIYIKLMAQACNVPMHYFDPAGDVPSGESLRTADAPLVKRAKSMSLLFGGALQDALTDALSLLEVDANPVVAWSSPESTDDLDAWTVVKAKVEAGISPYLAFQEAGYTPEQLEAQGISPDASGFNEKIMMLSNISKVLQGFSYGVTAGIVSPEQVQAIIDQLIGNTANEAA